ncbi:tryptophan synthase subunit alpha [Streptomyces sp. NPDC097610]|uniref:tryptophan synthase subunit alpha n=1 Tax=Streptomyces sp. NPDC097610 TaxID=3157227 RepID=UPI003324B488
MTTPPTPASWPGSRLDQVLTATRLEGRAALAAYWPVGYPTLNASLDILRLLARSADVLELGIPHTSPVLDGPVIRSAVAQSLASGYRMDHLLHVIRELSASTAAALVVMTYWNPVARYGALRFTDDLAAAGAAAVLLPDIQIEDTEPWLRAARARGLHSVFLASPHASTSGLARIRSAGSGMVYAPATAGLTGSQGPLDPQLGQAINRLRAVTSLPVAVGIGVSTPQQAAQVSAVGADAVVVGSALIRRYQTSPGPAGAAATSALADQLAQGVRRTLRPAA